MLKKMYDLQKKKGKKGFSMIELIIVLAIMAILVALIGTQLIPYLEKSREKRDKTTLDTCKTALESVMADHEFVPSSGATTVSGVLSDIDTAKSATGGTAATAATAATEFETYAGIGTGATPFKSSDAGTSSKVGDVSVTFDGNGVITQMTVGTLNLIE